ncbi:MAG: hypothetical protein KDB90_04280 [Planctomycetes bacterium]|nr:hypothetical protein [Planctomycetota bacterium]
MQQALDWILGNAIPIIGGTILFVGILAVIVLASRQSGKDNEKASESNDPTKGE